MGLIMIIAGLLIFQSVTYFGVQKLEGPAHDVKISADERIPYRPAFIFIYVLWYPMIAFFPMVLYCYSPGGFAEYMVMIILDILISLLIYMVYPTSFERPEPDDGFLGRIMTIVYRCDYKGKNCMPSMHCSMCFIIMFSALSCSRMDIWLQIPVCVLAALIVVSTVMTKQHVIVDVAAAFALALVCCMASVTADNTAILDILGLQQQNIFQTI